MRPIDYIIAGVGVALVVFVILMLAASNLSESKTGIIINKYCAGTSVILAILYWLVFSYSIARSFFNWYIHAASQLF